MAENITNKYRPRTFSGILGNTYSIDNVKNTIISGKIPPTYLLYGLRGMGKTTLARVMAMSLNCHQRVGAEPCGICDSCQSIINGFSSNLREIDGAKSRDVESMRDLIDTLGFIVPDGEYRVVVIDECHMLTKEAWNTSLKTLEEPPPNTLIILCTTEYQKVPPTILSRSVRIQFPGTDDETLINMLKKILSAEGVEYEDKALETIAKYSSGSIRDAQSILEGFIRSGKVTAEKVKGIYQPVDPNTIHDYFSKVLTKDPQKCSRVFGNWIKLGITPEYVVANLMEYLTDMLLEFTITDAAIKPVIKAQRDKIGDARITAWLDFLYTQLRYIRDFPMTYTLLMNLVTIKLMHEDGEIKVSRKKEKAEKADEAVAPASIPVASVRVSTQEVETLKKLCGGIIVEMEPNMQRITLKNKNGNVFDIVTQESFAKNGLYLLSSDLTLACTDYPNNMAKVAKQK